MEENSEKNSVEVTTEERGTTVPEEAIPEVAVPEGEEIPREELSRIADEVFDDAPKAAGTGDPAEAKLTEGAAAEEIPEQTEEAGAPPEEEKTASPDGMMAETPKPAAKSDDSAAAAGPDRIIADEAQKESPQADEAKPAAERDYKAEFLELGKAYPELIGRQIPDEVFREAVTSGKTVLNCYHTHLIHEQQRELDRLRSEVKTLRQNADNARRAPVGSVMGHPPTAKAANPYESAWDLA